MPLLKIERRHFAAIAIWLLLPLVAFTTAQGQALSKPAQAAMDRSRAHFSRDTRVFGGADVKIADNPWQVALVLTSLASNEDAQFCGGSIVAVRWIITAAHCVDAGMKSSQISILLGTDSLRIGGRRIPLMTDGIHIHQDWHYLNHENDIALLEVTEDLNGVVIGGWTLAQPEEEGRDVRITGWGALSWQKSPPVSILLQGADVKVVSSNKCNARDSYDRAIKENMLCIGNYSTGSQDTCDRDSGGPATTIVDGKRELIGITSWGAPHCGTPKMPGVYTRLSQFKPWLRNTSRGDVHWD